MQIDCFWDPEPAVLWYLPAGNRGALRCHSLSGGHRVSAECPVLRKRGKDDLRRLSVTRPVSISFEAPA